MADYGLGKAIRSAIKKGTEDVRVLRPGEVDTAVKPELAPAVAPETAAIKETPVTAQKTPAATPETPAVETPFTAATPKPEPVVSPTVAPATEADAPSIDRILTRADEEADTITRAKLADVNLEDSHHINFDKITSPEDVKSTIAMLAEKNKASVNAARRDVISDAEMKSLADDLGGAPQSLLKKVLARESGGLLQPETIMATRQWINSSAERLNELATKITTGTATDVDRIALMRQQQLHSAVYDQLMGSRAEWGRTGRVLNSPMGQDPLYLARMRETMDNVHGKTHVDELAQMIVDAKTTRGITKVARKFEQSKFWGVLNELRVGALLSNPVTHFKNIIGNTVMGAANIAETAVAARLGRFLSGDEHIQVGEAASLLHGNMAATRDALRAAYRTIKTGESVGDAAKYNTGIKKQISAGNLLPPNWQSTHVGKLLDVIGEVVRSPSARGLGSMDEFYKTLAYRAELERQAYIEAHTALAGTKTPAEREAIMEKVSENARNMFENTPANIQKLADDYSKYATFQDALGPIGRAATTFLRSHGALSLLAPFIRTPINIFKRTLGERTPLALFSAKFRADLSGRNGGRVRDMAAARLAMGTSTSLLVAGLAADGTITGYGPTNHDAREILMATGWRPYSIMLTNPFTGEQYYKSYAGIEPIASLLGIVADTIELHHSIEYAPETMQDESQQIDSIASHIVASIAQNTMSKSYVKGLADATEMLSDPNRYFSSWIRDMGVSSAPFSGARSFLTKVEDPLMREAWTMTDKLRQQSGIPGYSENAPAKRNLFGEEVQWPKGSLIGALSPMPESPVKYDSTIDGLKKVMEDSRKVPVTMPDRNIEGMKLTAAEYSQYVQYRNEPVNGKTFKDSLQRVMDSSTYQRATPDMQSELLRHVQESYDRAGREKLEKENLDYAQRIIEYRAKNHRLKYGT